jgi:glutamyl-tRNA synthetase
VVKFNQMIRTRFAPSPTGDLHIGGLRTALYSYALAKHFRGTFILRIEDTDKKREVEGSLEQIKNLLKTFGLAWDEYCVQSERLELYQKAAKKLVSDGYAFYCQCKAKNAKDSYSKQLRDPCRTRNLDSGAIKLKVPDGEGISFVDFVLGKKVSWGTSTVSDTTLLKSDGFPTYHLAVVVDDHETKITHALRGHDWMPSTPVHLLVYKYLGYDLPEIGHLTDILDPDGGKLSKRKGSVSCSKMLAEGYLHSALLNFVMLLGWAPKDDREFYTLEEFVGVFDKNGLQKANPIFNRDKLNWFNGQYLQKLSDYEFAKKVRAFAPESASMEELEKVAPLVKDRLKKLSEFNDLAGFIFEKKEPARATDNYQAHISNATISLQQVGEWSKPNIDEALLGVVKEHDFKTGDFFMDLRTTVSGSRTTPPINDSIELMGKGGTITMLEEGLKKFSK